jgi:putative ABC transport system substrate-binding protein
MRRRDFITLIGGVPSMLWPLAARAQQPATPVIGYLGLSSPEAQASTVAGFRKGLTEAGYVEDHNVTIEFRWAESHFDRFPALAADLVRRRVGVIFANSPAAVRAAKAASATIPIVFLMGEDPVKEGLVPSLNRPGANVTGVSDFANQLAGKRLSLLRDTVPKATVYAFLVRPSNPNAESDAMDAMAAARGLGLDLRVLRADNEREIDAAFATMAQLVVGALFVNIDPFFVDRHEQLVALAAHHAVPAIYAQRDFPVAGGLMSYGVDRFESSRQAGAYVGRVLKGEKPADLPVQQSTKLELIINLKAAKALGLEISPGVLAIADEVIE